MNCDWILQLLMNFVNYFTLLLNQLFMRVCHLILVWLNKSVFAIKKTKQNRNMVLIRLLRCMLKHGAGKVQLKQQ